MSFTYASSKVTKIEYGVFVRKIYPSEVYDLANGYVENDRFRVAMMLDIPIDDYIITSSTIPPLSIVNTDRIYLINGTGSADIDIGTSDIDVGDVSLNRIVLYNNSGESYTGLVTFTDDNSNKYTIKENEGIIIQYNTVGWVVGSRTFTPIGVCKEQPKIATEKEDSIKTSFGVSILLAETIIAEASNMEVTKNNYDFLLDLQSGNVDFCLYAHSSNGIASDGMLISKNTGLKDGWVIRDIPIYSSLKVTGNDLNLIDISIDKTAGIGEATVTAIANYSRDYRQRICLLIPLVLETLL